ncbi:putative endopolyphosphatase protein [Rosellinia necatrix]|uniref:Endopolyphosphatase n=1 Tax=Rosellinia necatrix TaxID=77044 RepID=A0A1S7UJR9_ROSNE|nr:putative endopolyphosphatase protein [Rosellinia necatrix]
MAPLKALQWAALMLPNLLAQLPCGGASAAGSQVVLQQQQPHEGPGSEQTPLATSQRRLRGKFLHITDLHPDEHYKPHTSTRENLACHRGKGPAGVYGAETSDCDAPLTLVDATLAWVREHLRDEIDFVVWTGDSARHDSDETLPRHNKDILAMNRRIADSFVDTFSDDDGRGLVVPVVPTFGNNDIYPHNILLPGPNDILRTYGGIWARFIPEAQRHSFEFGGWFYVEVIPGRLAVFSLNTMYFFDRNAGIDDCVHPAEPGYGHFEWLLVQLDALRARGMKAILMGHVPPARTVGKQLWEETCWQKYTLWLQRYRDVVVGSLYGHMNIDHFLLQDTDDIDMALIRAATTSSSSASADDEQASTTRETMGEDDFSIQSGASYLKELRDDWAKLPSPVALEQGVDEGIESGRGRKGKGKGKFGGRWAERYQLTLISPSVVPNYFPGLRVFEYNITGLEETPTWMDPARTKEGQQLAEDVSEVHELKKRQDSDLEAEKKKKRKGKGKKPPADPGLRLPEPPPRGTPPGPAYRPQALTLLGFTQYYANLTHINNDLAGDASSSPSPSSSSSSSSSWLPSSWLPSGWNPGKHEGRRPARPEPRPRAFGFEVEYSTFDDRVYGLADLTVKSFVRLAHRIGQASEKSVSAAEHYDDDDDDDDATTATTTTDNYGEDETYDDDLNESPESRRSSVKKDKKKGNKGKGKGKESHKTWLHFLKHAFVSTKNKEELEDL